MKNRILIILLFVGIRHSFSQFLVDSTYCVYDSINYNYTFTHEVAYSDLGNSEIFHYGDNAANIVEQLNYKDPSGLTHHKFIQSKNDVPILNSEIFIRELGGTIIDATGLINTNIPALTDKISAEYAVSSLLSYLDCFQYKWQDTSYTNDSSVFLPKPTLAIIKTENNDFLSASNYKYVYPINVSALYSSSDSIYIDSTYYVNAVNGSIIRRFSSRVSCFEHPKKTKEVPPCYTTKSTAELLPICAGQSCMGTSPTLRYYGTEPIYTERYLYGALSCTHRLKDNCTGTYLYVTKMPQSFGEVDFRDNANSWTGTSGNPPDITGATSLWCVEMTHDFFRNTLGRNSYDNNYSQIKAQVQSNTTGGTSWNMVSNDMWVGHSSGSSHFESTLDIIGHEIGHGVGDQICFLMQDGNVGNTDEEGALGEGYSDIFGQGVEHYVHNNFTTTGVVDDYFQGSNIPGGLTFQKERFLNTPKTNGNPDTYSGVNWLSSPTAGSNNWHRNSTIISHWYYLLAEGGSGTNDNSNFYCVSGIGQEKAMQIAYHSLYYLGGTAKQFANARQAAIQAATTLYGSGSNEVAQTTAAWYAVGVGTNYSGTTNISNHTTNGIETYAHNSAILVQGFHGQSSSNVVMTSNTQIALLPDDAYDIGASFSAYITSGNNCNGGARFINPGSVNNNDATPNSDINTESGAQKEKPLFNCSVMPNPNNGNFIISFNTPITGKLLITNELGLVVHQENLELATQKKEIQMPGAGKGIYFLKIVSPLQNIKPVKLIIE